MNVNPLTQIDFYKADHRRQYTPGTTMVYSNLTARSDTHKNIPDALYTGNIVFFGLQYFIKNFLHHTFNREFFNQPKSRVVAVYKRRMDNALGKDAIPVEHIEALHDLGYLPITIRALPEGTVVPLKVPMLVIYNNHPDFFWLTNYLETVLSASIWKPIVSATTSYHYRKLLDKYASETGTDGAFVQFQAHDFSFRGMSGMQDAAMSGAAHLVNFVGTDTVSAIDLLEDYYLANSDNELVGCSVPATEHSCMMSGSKENEQETYRRIIQDTYPKGIVSIVSDTWDFFNVINKIAVNLKPIIMGRDGKVVFRPDSGDPVKILCGDLDATPGSAQFKGAVECLWENFGGTVNEKGFKVLDSHVGLIYGDSITIQRAHEIMDRLKIKGFSSGNVVLGIGSYTYQGNTTRDTYGMAIKSTYVEIAGVPREIFKDPITDKDKFKKSAKGIINVFRDSDGKLTFQDQCDPDIINTESALELAFSGRAEGNYIREQSLSNIRENVRKQ